jgi:hypothetical protein
MSVWFFIVLVVGILYALDRLTTTTDLPVSARLARARSIVEEGRRRRAAASVTPVPSPPSAKTPDEPTGRAA